MTNKDVQKLKKFIKFCNIIDMIPVHIPNWPEKLSMKKVNGNQRSFDQRELGLIEAALLAVAHTIYHNAGKTE